MPKPALRLWNADLAKDLGGLEPDPRLWVGGRLMEGMQPHAHRGRLYTSDAADDLHIV